MFPKWVFDKLKVISVRLEFYFSITAAEQIQTTTNHHKGIEENVMSASYEVDKVWYTLVLQLRQHHDEKQNSNEIQKTYG